MNFLLSAYEPSHLYQADPLLAAILGEGSREDNVLPVILLTPMGRSMNKSGKFDFYGNVYCLGGQCSLSGHQST